MILRREAPEDLAVVTAIHDVAFRRASGGRSVESMLVEALRRDGDAIDALCVVALDGDEVVGHVMCSRGRVGEVPVPALGPIGVRPSHQGAGVGSALVHAVVAAADALDERAVFLLGDPAYYGRFGFEPGADHGVLPPEPRWGRHFQVRPLTAWVAAPCRGTFRYPAAFEGL